MGAETASAPSGPQHRRRRVETTDEATAVSDVVFLLLGDSGWTIQLVGRYQDVLHHDDGHVAVSPSHRHVRDGRHLHEREPHDRAIDYDAIDFFRGDELVADPYPYFDWLRSQCPVRQEPSQGVYMVTGYDEAYAMYADTDTFSSCNSVTGPVPRVFPCHSRSRRRERPDRGAPRRAALQRSDHHDGPAGAPGPPPPADAPAHPQAAEGERGVRLAAGRSPDRRVHGER